MRRQCSVVALPTADRKAELRVVVSRIFKIRQQLQAAIIVRCPNFREQRRACTGWGCEFDRTACVCVGVAALCVCCCAGSGGAGRVVAHYKADRHVLLHWLDWCVGLNGVDVGGGGWPCVLEPAHPAHACKFSLLMSLPSALVTPLDASSLSAVGWPRQWSSHARWPRSTTSTCWTTAGKSVSAVSPPMSPVHSDLPASATPLGGGGALQLRHPVMCAVCRCMILAQHQRRGHERGVHPGVCSGPESRPGGEQRGGASMTLRRFGNSLWLRLGHCQ